MRAREGDSHTMERGDIRLISALGIMTSFTANVSFISVLVAQLMKRRQFTERPIMFKIWIKHGRLLLKVCFACNSVNVLDKTWRNWNLGLWIKILSYACVSNKWSHSTEEIIQSLHAENAKRARYVGSNATLNGEILLRSPEPPNPLSISAVLIVLFRNGTARIAWYDIGIYITSQTISLAVIDLLIPMLLHLHAC